MRKIFVALTILAALCFFSLGPFATSVIAGTYNYDISQGDIIISAGTNPDTIKVSYGVGLVDDNIQSSQSITITGSSDSYSVNVAANLTSFIINITLDNVNIYSDPFKPANERPFYIGANSTVHLTLSGANVLDGVIYLSKLPKNVGLGVPYGATLIIDAANTADSLSAIGGYNGAGIGGEYGNSGNVIINGGTVTATGGYYSAGIGGGGGGMASNVTINGGKVNAEASGGGAGIGGGSPFGGVSTVTINGGEVNAEGSGSGAGIGGGSANSGIVTINGGTVTAIGGGSGGSGIGGGSIGSVTINGGSVNASPKPSNVKDNSGISEYLVTISGLPASAAVSYEIDGVPPVSCLTDINGKLYLWLRAAAGSAVETTRITTSVSQYAVTGEVTAGTNNFAVYIPLETTPTAEPGTALGTTIISASPNTSGNELLYLVSTSFITVPEMNSTDTPAGAYTTGNNLTADSGNWAGVYELNGSGEIVAFGEILLGTGDILLPESTLTYTAGANGSITGSATQIVNYGSDGTAVTAVPDTGFHFVKWSDDVTTATRTDENITGNISVTAIFTINQYTITFNSNGGSTVSSQAVNYNETAHKPTNPTKTGFTFAEWYTDSELAVAYNFATAITSDIPLYAKWVNLGPSGTIAINAGNGLTNSTSVALTLSATDPGGDPVTHMCFSNDSINWTAWEVYAVTKNYTLPSGDGMKAVSVKFKDSAGSVGGYSSDSIELDTIRPSIAGVSDNTAYNINVTPVFTEGTASLSKDGGSAGSLISGTTVSVAGIYVLVLTDAAGNNASVRFTIDKTAPTGTIVINSGDEITISTSAALTLTSSDGSGTGVAQMRFSNDGSTWSTWEEAKASKTWIIQSAYGTVTVYMQLKDGSGNVSGNITDTILHKSIPEASDSVKNGMEDTSLQLSNADFAYSNADGNPLSKIMIMSLPTQGALKLSAGNITVSQEVNAADIGNLVFLPGSNWNGTTSFRWKGSDGVNYSSQSATLNINIAAVNDPPTANSSSLTTNAGAAGNSLLSAGDIDGNSLTYNVVSQGSKGIATITGTSTGAYTYIPNDGAYGSDSFTFKVNDGSIDSNTATVTINIIPAGVANLSALSISAGTLTPSFATNTMNYLVSVDNHVSNLSITASVENVHSTLKINGVPITKTLSGEYTNTIILNVGANNITVEVTAQDGVTQKSYVITVTRLPSSNADLASVEMGVNITPVFDADTITYSGSVGYSSNSITVEPVTAVSSAAVTINGNVLIGESTDVLLNVGNNTISIGVTAQDGVTQKIYTFNIYRSNRGSGSQIQNSEESTDYYTEIANEGEKTTITFTVNEKELQQRITEEGNNSTLTFQVNTEADVFVAELNGQMVKNMEAKQMVVEVKTGAVTYTLPVQQLKIDALSEQIGQNLELKDIKIQIEISRPNEERVQIVENSSEKGKFTIVVPPIEFTVKCRYEDKLVEVNSFNSYVERTIAIPDGVEADKITTGIVVEPDGTVRHVPTKIIVIDGKYYAKIYSLTNSTYSVIWNPVKFKDVESHWAKDAVNDMGSRMIIGGVGNGRFEPDRDISRAEFAEIIVRALGLRRSENGEDAFNDVPKDAWYYKAVSTASEYGLIYGFGNGEFRPMDKITRAQAMIMVAKAMKITELEVDLADNEVNKILAVYVDANSAVGYAKTSIASCIKASIFTGKSGKLIAPKENITRAEVAVIVRRMLQKSDLI